MALQISGIRRNLKNIAHNYTDAQIKVREATSNDPWGPSSTLMSEVADLTYNVVAFTEIMQMIWKRLNDHGRNWRHVYKALVLLEYLIKTGSEKVADQCKENIFAIQTLKDFQYIEENKDQGMNVREKAKALVTLLKDDERLRNERVRALKAKERFAQSVSGIGSDSDISSPTSPSYPDTYVTSSSRPAERNAYGVSEGPSNLEPQLEAARPQTVGEEELQLQLALAMSKEEAEQEEQKQRSDDVRLQMAITQSEEDFKDGSKSTGHGSLPPREYKRSQKEDLSAMNDLLDINFNPHGGANGGGARSVATPPAPSLDPWGMPAPAPSASPQHVAQPKSVPAAGLTPSPPPVPPLPVSSNSFFTATSKISFRHSNPPFITSFLSSDFENHLNSAPNPFVDLSAAKSSIDLSRVSQGNMFLSTDPSVSRPSSLFLAPPTQQNFSTSLPSTYSLFPPATSFRSSSPLPNTSLSPNPCNSTSFGPSSAPLSRDSSPLPPASYNPWGAVQVNITAAPLAPTCKTDPWGSPASGPPSRVTSPPTTDPWGVPPAKSPEPPMGGICGNDPWAVLSAPPSASRATPPVGNNDPWNPVPAKTQQPRDPFAPISPTNNGDIDEFSALSSREKPAKNGLTDAFDPGLLAEDGLSDAFDLSGLGSSMPENNTREPQKSKSPAAFLGENSNLVNLDNLVSAKHVPGGLGLTPLNSTSASPLIMNNINNNLNNNLSNTTTSTNPFAPSSFTGVNPFSAPSPPNPFQAQQAPKPSMNQLRTTGIGGSGLSVSPAPTGIDHGPWGPQQPSTGFGMAPPAASQEENPFFL
ncbi:epsin-2-like isoform X2 [Macrobrachium nipponense]|uniref:epsin-2-like isoform X2 n=1 Tax=Macrobrachium nipponense TaxID=159736 RepID=UPI0030C85754